MKGLDTVIHRSHLLEFGGNDKDSDGKYYLTPKTFSTENLTWRILGTNSDGKLELISENIPNTTFNLLGEDSYFYAPEALDEMCNELYGNGLGAASARDLKSSDFDKLAGIKTDADRKNLYNNYGLTWSYRFPTELEASGTRYLQYKNNSGSASEWTNSTYKKFMVPLSDEVFDESTPGYTSSYIGNNYNYMISNKIKQTTQDGKKMSDILTKGTTNNYIISQILSSQYISCWSGGIDMGLFFTTYDNFTQMGTFQSMIGRYIRTVSVRPVVTLNSDIKLLGDSTTGWTIQ